MVSATDYPGKPGILGHRDRVEQPRKPRFRLFAALDAPFREVDDRALYKKRAPDVVRNNSKGNLFVPAKVQVRRFPRGD